VELSHDVVRHQVQIENIQRELQELREDVKQITIILNRAEGSWKTMVMAGGVVAAMGAGVTKLLSMLGGH